MLNRFSIDLLLILTIVMTQMLLPTNYAKLNKTRPISFNISLGANPTKWLNTLKQFTQTTILWGGRLKRYDK